MRGILASAVVLSASAFGALIPYSELKARGYGYAKASPLVDCLDSAGLDPVVEGDSAYATGAAPFNLRYVLATRLIFTRPGID